MLKGIRVSPVTSCPCPAPCHSVILADSDCYRWAFLWRYHTSVWAASRSFSKELLEKKQSPFKELARVGFKDTTFDRAWRWQAPKWGTNSKHKNQSNDSWWRMQQQIWRCLRYSQQKKKHDSRLRGHCRSKQKFDLDNLIMALGHTEGYPKWWLKHPGTGPLPPIDSSLKLSALNNFLLVVSTLSLIGILGMSSRDYRVI